MPYLESLEEWQKQSALLLQARPTTARVTTKYNIPNLTSKRYAPKAKKEDADAETEGQSRTPWATVTLKTYDPVSGVTLKFKTDRAADVGRTIAGLGTLGRHMAALPPKTEVREVDEMDVTPAQTTTETKQPPAQSSGAGKKKKNKKR